MAFKMKGFSGFKSSPAKQVQSTKPEKKTPSYIDKDTGMVDNDKRQKYMADLADKKEAKKPSPAKQEGPIDKKQLKLQKGEMDGTDIYNPKEDKDMSKDFVKSERINDLEDRAGFLTDNDITNDGSKEDNQRIKTAKKLQHEADILRNRKPKKK